ncbi:DNA-binding transcriptional regulator, GntR family [Lentibacillus halodurans]|uniref:DNA-binding transcriptional regulator, GntR family n=1 Tax=Lentibacillus halodurans TaxID=237679 RepID=A0A1I1AMN0_9BACI|nr:GntR family transcriptional regulator [Lentibacillus halodurans]SFB39197.1 DNA-binding transcriptional regulator, GntR family [Lentibacillus halodurans]
MQPYDHNVIMQKPLSELIADELKRKIWNEEIQFGERLLETELAESYDVSRSTIREALKILESEELVVSQARKGTYVADFTDQDVNEMIELRTLIESHAFMQAMTRLESEHTKKLEEIVGKMKEKADENDWNGLFDLDMQFHSYVVGLCGNSRIIKIYDSLQVQIRTFLMHLDRYYSSPQSFYAEHKQLLEALVSNDVHTVNGRVREHIEYVETKLLGQKNDIKFKEV